ncbi:MAG TPA: hypothetical protein VMP67_06530 [Candidatus Limnocylindria bacterium]|nr:hypothetical protein [Candidatus Limnocylindria bacterium]
MSRNQVQPAGRPGQARVSRAPVYVVVVGLALAVVLVFVAARQAAAPAAPPDLSSPGTSERPRSVNLIMRDYSFDPTPLYLVAGEVVQLNVINGGLVAHEAVLGGQDVQVAWAAAHAVATPPAPFATAPPASVPPATGGLRVLLGSGQATSLTYEVPADMQLLLMCHLPGHVEQGMVGRVELQPR